MVFPSLDIFLIIDFAKIVKIWKWKLFAKYYFTAIENYYNFFVTIEKSIIFAP